MAKKHRGRPALRAVQIWGLIVGGGINTHQVPNSPILILVKGKTVWQKWLGRRKDKTVVRKSAATYIRKGTLFVPIWYTVPRWEMDYYRNEQINFAALGIREIRGRYMRLCYMQVEDLDHALRQQDHVLDQYFDLKGKKVSDFASLLDLMARAERIRKKVELRKMCLTVSYNHLQADLKSIRRSVRNLATNAPIFLGKSTEASQQAVTSTLTKYAATLREYPMRPVGTRLLWAARSLDLAVGHIQNGRTRLALDRLKAALKNLEYPSPA